MKRIERFGGQVIFEVVEYKGYKYNVVASDIVSAYPQVTEKGKDGKPLIKNVHLINAINDFINTYGCTANIEFHISSDGEYADMLHGLKVFWSEVNKGHSNLELFDKFMLLLDRNVAQVWNDAIDEAQRREILAPPELSAQKETLDPEAVSGD